MSHRVAAHTKATFTVSRYAYLITGAACKEATSGLP